MLASHGGATPDLDSDLRSRARAWGRCKACNLFTPGAVDKCSADLRSSWSCLSGRAPWMVTESRYRPRMPWTALHAALGDTTANLTFGMIVRACDAGVEETAALDWKAALPLTEAKGDARNHQKAELAKDIAAMANSGGGLVVFGVAETDAPGISAAERIEPLGVIEDATLQQIRQVAGALIYPPVVGLELIPLAPANDPAGGVLALVVPDSTAVPHLVHPENQKTFEYFMAPYRHGPHTERMVEQQLATAYRQRDQAARTRAAQLDQIWAQAIAPMVGGPTWAVAVAVPEIPHPRPREFTIEQADEIFDAICRPGLPAAVGALQLAQQGTTRVALRRYRRNCSRVINPPGQQQAKLQGRVELHGDGSVVVAATRDTGYIGGPATGGPHEVAIIDLEQVGLDLLRTLRESQGRRGFHGDYAARIGISPDTQVFRRSDPALLGHFVPFDPSHRVLDFRPVDGPIIGSRDESILIASTFDVITDVVSQTGASLYSDPTSWAI